MCSSIKLCIPLKKKVVFNNELKTKILKTAAIYQKKKKIKIKNQRP